ncbi:MAG: IMP dehydrogenase [Candidatus Niyogibacteria bacterium CG10_big_fil_rev_8_21_14_0_10_42_19]|uniref:IMP dehydrogenase n=1 Tax=Candidatus Niyogibacteria bacterium CG10_big_fil_rev_8_21_14_0_10_42_19 TaxID=1974725 RepID=A0A2H0TGI9_9BACT|nr:MAG: IMP dehydrogenase [Candidatus Niyogibacteria bacterium CG10_big_fil_rev_8_21_14_0_10_42_19]
MIKEGLSFDDVLLVPRRSGILSRKDVFLGTRFSRGISLELPLVSANMDTVTEAKMARFMAEVGGIGVIHRFLSIEDQAEEVRKVKRAENIIIEDPYTINEESTIAEARKLMADFGVSGLLVKDSKDSLSGILTHRDLLFDGNDSKKIRTVMTKKVIFAPPKITIEKAKKIMHEHRIEKLPLVARSGKIKGLITLKDILKKTENPRSSKDKKGRLLVAAAVGVKEETEARARALLDAGVDVVVIDVAHGHSAKVFHTLKMLRKKFGDIEVIAGNVATPSAVRDIAKAGASGIKVGIGPGAACTTRVIAGVGIPQITAIIECAKAARRFKIPIIADGGVKNSGDLSKALAAGADSVMIGSLFSGTDEAPGEYVIENGAAYKFYRGMASYEAGKDKQDIDGTKDKFSRTPEGKSGRVHYRGPAKNVISELTGGLRSSMSYLGAHNLDQFRKNAEFIKITGSGYIEGTARN